MEKSIPLKEIVGFLPYRLKCYAQGMSTADTEFDEYPKPKEFEIIGLDVKYVSIYEEGRTVAEEMEYCDIIPHVRPLSDLTKEITHNGETFVPIIVLSGYDKIKSNEISTGYEHKKYYVKLRPESVNAWFYHSIPSDLLSMDYFTVQKLLEWHFDIYDWIKDGKAIDINTLKP